MKWYSWRIILGAVLVVFGAMALVQSLGLTRFEGQGWGLVPAALFIIVGAGFLPLLAQDRKANWWAVIPGFTLIGLGLLVLLAVLNFQPDIVLPAIFMTSIGASFWTVYAMDRAKWWAIIPGGALVSLAALLLVSDQGSWPAVALFTGLAITFALVALLVQPGQPQRAWAWWPAGSLAVLAVIISVTADPLTGIIWPIILIAAGLFLVGWTVFAKRA
jgi:hypothetical protein